MKFPITPHCDQNINEILIGRDKECSLIRYYKLTFQNKNLGMVLTEALSDEVWH